MLVTADGAAVRIAAEDIPVQGRATQGKRMAKLDAPIVEVARVASESEERTARRGTGNRQLELIE